MALSYNRIIWLALGIGSENKHHSLARQQRRAENLKKMQHYLGKLALGR